MNLMNTIGMQPSNSKLFEGYFLYLEKTMIWFIMEYND